MNKKDNHSAEWSLNEIGYNFQNFICEHENSLDAMPMNVDAN